MQLCIDRNVVRGKNKRGVFPEPSGGLGFTLQAVPVLSVALRHHHFKFHVAI